MELVKTCHDGKTKLYICDAPVDKQKLQAALETALQKNGMQVSVTRGKQLPAPPAESKKNTGSH